MLNTVIIMIMIRAHYDDSCVKNTCSIHICIYFPDNTIPAIEYEPQISVVKLGYNM